MSVTVTGGVIRFRCNRDSSDTREFNILDENNDGVPVSSLTAATLKLFDLDIYEPGSSPATGIINGRDDQNVLNTNNVLIDSDGHVTWSAQPEDHAEPDNMTDAHAVYVQRRQVWRRKALFVFTWATGQFIQPMEIETVNVRGAV